MARGFMYLMAIIDVYSRKTLGWAISIVLKRDGANRYWKMQLKGMENPAL